VALSEVEQATFDALRTELTGAVTYELDRLDRYYDGIQRLEQLGLAIPPELMRFTVVVNWPRVVVDAVADRLDVKGFRLPGLDAGDAELMALWQANGLTAGDLMARLDYLVYGRTYKIVGTNETDPLTPLITIESPRSVITVRDPRSGLVAAALKVFDIDDAGFAHAATLYLPDQTIWLANDSAIGQTGWREAERDVHELGVVPVVPTFRRRRTTIPAGRLMQGTSAMADVIPITDAAARDITNAQIAQETHAVPARVVLGASKGDFIDQNDKPLTVWESYFGSVWAMSNPAAKIGQFDSSDMVNFERMMDLYSRLASGVSGLPPNYFGLAADDAASADAIRSRESRLVKIAERDQVALGEADAAVMRIAMRIRDGEWSKDLRGIETLWYDAGTPTMAQRTDAVVKMYSATDANGVNLLPAEMAYEELGWSPGKIERALALRAAEQVDPYLRALSAQDVAAAQAAANADNATAAGVSA
jgi:hypothetical protein